MNDLTKNINNISVKAINMQKNVSITLTLLENIMTHIEIIVEINHDINKILYFFI